MSRAEGFRRYAASKVGHVDGYGGVTRRFGTLGAVVLRDDGDSSGDEGGGRGCRSASSSSDDDDDDC